MKKYILPCLLATSFAATAQADKLGFEVGVTAWHTKQELMAKHAKTQKSKSEVSGGLYAEFEHFIPFVPNIRVEYLQNKNDLRHSKNRSETSFTDITLYYQLLDNWINLDLGASARRMDAEINVKAGGNHKADHTLAALYSRLQFDIFDTGLSLGVAAHHDGGISSSKGMQDYQAYLRYQGFAGLGFKAGYRMQKYKLNYNKGVKKAEIDVDGAFVQAFWKF